MCNDRCVSRLMLSNIPANARSTDSRDPSRRRGAITIVTAIGPPTAPDVVDVVALGESMVAFLPSRPGRLADVPSFDRAIGVPSPTWRARWRPPATPRAGSAGSGRTASAITWSSRSGRTGSTSGSCGATRAARRASTSARRGPRHRRPRGGVLPAGSAASAMTVGNTDLDAVRAGRILHLSGITAALSEDCLGLVRELTAPGAGRPLVSFDVNHRPGLWRDADGPRVLLELARGADIVFVGDDEAREAWGCTAPARSAGHCPSRRSWSSSRAGTGDGARQGHRRSTPGRHGGRRLRTRPERRRRGRRRCRGRLRRRLPLRHPAPAPRP